MEVLNAMSSATDAKPRTINAKSTSTRVSPASEYRPRLDAVVRAVSSITRDFDRFMRHQPSSCSPSGGSRPQSGQRGSSHHRAPTQAEGWATS